MSVPVFARKKLKKLLVPLIAITSGVGVVSLGVFFFFPDELQVIHEKITAQAKEDYKLPEKSPEPVAGVNPADTKFLKSFSKVFSGIAKETRPGVVLIVAEKKVTVNQPAFPEDFFFPFLPPQFQNPQGGGRGGRPQRQNKETDAGSGFLVDLKNGYAITNNHVIDGADKITVTTYDNKKYSAKLIGTAKNLDIAVIKLQKFSNSNLKQLNLANSDSAEVGDWVLAMGAPFELPQTVTMGVVSAVKRSSDVLGINGPNNFIQTDASINPGNSGGPLLDLDGQVVGMNTAIYSKNGTSVGIGFAIPSNTIRMVANSIISHGKFAQAYLGVEMYDARKISPSGLKNMKIAEDTAGGLIMRVIPGSPASKAGLQPLDVIQSVNGVAVKTPSEIQAQIMLEKPGQSVKIGVLRNKKSVTLTAVLDKAPNQGDASADDEGDKKHSQQSDIGLVLQLKGQKVVVSQVIPRSYAQALGFESGDVLLSINSKPIKAISDAESALSKAKKSNDGVVALIERGGNKRVLMQDSPQ